MANDIDQSIDAVVESMLLQKIQENPQNQVFNKLLIWQYSQTGRYKQALNQLYAIDKRTRSGENDIIEFGSLLYDNMEYDLAMEAFGYVMAKGKDVITSYSIHYTKLYDSFIYCIKLVQSLFVSAGLRILPYQ